MCSGPSKAEQQAQAAQAAFSQQMQSLFNVQFQQDQELVGYLKAQMQPIVDHLNQIVENPTGFSPQQMSNMQSALINTAGEQYTNAIRQAQQRFATTNLRGMPSGVQEQILGQIGAQEAGVVAQGTTNIQMANAQLAQQKQAQAETLRLSALGEMGQMVGNLQNIAPQTGSLFNQSNQQSFNQAYQMSQQGFGWGNLLSGVVGAGLGFATGGLSNLTSGQSFFGGSRGGGGTSGGTPSWNFTGP